MVSKADKRFLHEVCTDSHGKDKMKENTTMALAAGVVVVAAAASAAAVAVSETVTQSTIDSNVSDDKTVTAGSDDNRQPQQQKQEHTNSHLKTQNYHLNHSAVSVNCTSSTSTATIPSSTQLTMASTSQDSGSIELPPGSPSSLPLTHKSTHSTFSLNKNEEFNFQVPTEAPVFVPSVDEFKNPLTYISKIRPVAEKFGICKIKPPSTWQPPFTVDVDKLRFTPRVQRLNELEAKTRVKLNFLDQIAKFWELQGSSLKIPMVERKALDLYSLHRHVQKEGGLEQVTKDRKWSKVACRLGYPAGKNVGTILKGHYERILYPFDLFTLGKTEDGCISGGGSGGGTAADVMQQKLEEYEVDDHDYKPHGIASRQKLVPPVETTARRSQRTNQNLFATANQQQRHIYNNGGSGSNGSAGAGSLSIGSGLSSDITDDTTGITDEKMKDEKTPFGSGANNSDVQNTLDDDLKNAELRRLHIYGAGPKMAGFRGGRNNNNNNNNVNDSGNAIMQQKSRMNCGNTGSVMNFGGSGGGGVSFKSKTCIRRNNDPLAKYVCHICNRGDIEEAMLLCDGCDDSYHTFCLIPPLDNIPKGDWRCPKCVVEEVSKPTEAFGFEQAQREYTLQQFGEMADQFKADYFNIPVHLVPTELVEREFWRIVSSIDEDVAVEYGADLHTMDHGSGFPTKSSLYLLPGDQEYAESSWNLNNLPLLEESILGHINADISGMKVPWMYVGMCFATFCWHNEDHWSYSINYLHWGEPKTWYGVPGNKAEAFENTMKRAAPELFQSQPDLLHQLVTIMNPNILMNADVPVYRTDQHAGEFVITFPRAYHAGFNQGYNFAEAVNFAPADWMKMGRECVNHYSTLRRFCVFSHDELVCKMALEPDRLNLGIATACYLDMAEMVDCEKKLRKSLLEWGVTKAEREAFELLPDDERQCDVCKTTCFLSAVTCVCVKEIVCLRHYSELCKCSPDRHTLKYRYTLDELPLMLRKLKVKAESFENWLSKVRDVIDPNTPTTISLEDLQELAQEAEDKKFPGSVLLERLNSAVLEAEKCVTVIQQLDINKMRTRTRNSCEFAKYKLTLEELDLFVQEIDNLCCVIHEGNSVRELQQMGREFVDMANRMLKQLINTIDLAAVEKLIDDGQSLCIELPQIRQLKYVQEQVQWYSCVRVVRDSGEKIPLTTIKKLLNEGLNIVPHNILEKELCELQHIMAAVEEWEREAKKCFESGTLHEIPEIEQLLQQAEQIEGNLPMQPMLKDALKKAKEWLTTVERLQTNENYPYFHTLELVVNRGKNIPFQLEELKRMEDHLNSARQWKQRTSRTFLKKNSPFTLMEALSPRTEAVMHGPLSPHHNTSISSSGGSSSSIRFSSAVSSPILSSPSSSCSSSTSSALSTMIDDQMNKQFTEDMGPVQMVVSFKNAEEKEMRDMRELRSMNTLKNPEEDKFCVCRRRFYGNMYHCELCKEWFHSACVPTPRNTVRPRPAAIAGNSTTVTIATTTTAQANDDGTTTAAAAAAIATSNACNSTNTNANIIQTTATTQSQIKYLCHSCMRSRRPRLETILSLLVSLQRLPIRLPEGEALQCLTERAMNWQDRARQALATDDVVSALASLSIISQKCINNTTATTITTTTSTNSPKIPIQLITDKSERVCSSSSSSNSSCSLPRNTKLKSMRHTAMHHHHHRHRSHHHHHNHGRHQQQHQGRFRTAGGGTGNGTESSESDSDVEEIADSNNGILSGGHTISGDDLGLSGPDSCSSSSPPIGFNDPSNRNVEHAYSVPMSAMSATQLLTNPITPSMLSMTSNTVTAAPTPTTTATLAPLNDGTLGNDSTKSKQQLITLKRSTKEYLEDLMMEGDLLEVSLDETQHLWRILNATKTSHMSDLAYIHCKYKIPPHPNENLVSSTSTPTRAAISPPPPPPPPLPQTPPSSSSSTSTSSSSSSSSSSSTNRKRCTDADQTNANKKTKITNQRTSVIADSTSNNTTTMLSTDRASPSFALTGIIPIKPAATTIQTPPPSTPTATPKLKRGRKMKILTKDNSANMDISIGPTNNIPSDSGGGGSHSQSNHTFAKKKKRGRKSAQEQQTQQALAAVSNTNANTASGTTTSDEDEDCSAAMCARPTGREVDWVQCDGGCNQWFHMFCVGLVKSQVKPDDDFICKKCKQNVSTKNKCSTTGSSSPTTKLSKSSVKSPISKQHTKMSYSGSISNNNRTDSGSGGGGGGVVDDAGGVDIEGASGDDATINSINTKRRQTHGRPPYEEDYPDDDATIEHQIISDSSSSNSSSSTSNSNSKNNNSNSNKNKIKHIRTSTSNNNRNNCSNSISHNSRSINTTTTATTTTTTTTTPTTTVAVKADAAVSATTETVANSSKLNDHHSHQQTPIITMVVNTTATTTTTTTTATTIEDGGDCTSNNSSSNTNNSSNSSSARKNVPITAASITTTNSGDSMMIDEVTTSTATPTKATATTTTATNKTSIITNTNTNACAVEEGIIGDDTTANTIVMIGVSAVTGGASENTVVKKRSPLEHQHQKKQSQKLPPSPHNTNNQL